MTQKYKKYPIPLEAWKNFKLKQERMNQTFRKMTGTKKSIPLSNVILASSMNPLWFNSDEIKSLVGRRRKKNVQE